MRKLYLTFLVLSGIWCGAQAQGNGPGVWGARAAGLGQIGTVLEEDGWAGAGNAAALGSLRLLTVGVGAENRYLLPALNTVAVVAAMPLGPRNAATAPVAGIPEAIAAATAPRYGVLGFTAQRFGGKLYSEQRLGLGYGYRLGTVRVGARVEVLQTSFEGLGSRRVVAASLGGQADIIPRKLTFGATLYNLNQARLASYQDERVPTVLRAGLAWRASEKVLLLAETEKDVEQDADFKAGLEYVPVPVLALRAGLSSLTGQLTGGAGFQAGQFRIDYAAGWHEALGLSQQVSVAWQHEPKQP
ncbi:PorV/PorQ family protein [Hymenobacter seoulensis]